MRTEEFNHIILPMRSNLKAYALRLTESDDNGKRLRVYTIVDFSFIRTFAP